MGKFWSCFLLSKIILSDIETLRNDTKENSEVVQNLSDTKINGIKIQTMLNKVKTIKYVTLMLHPMLCYLVYLSQIYIYHQHDMYVPVLALQC